MVFGTDLAGETIFAMGRLDPADDGEAGFDTYGLIGAETGSADLPEGKGRYEGLFVASVSVDDAIASDTLSGTAVVKVDFGAGLVDVKLEGEFLVTDDGGDTDAFAVKLEAKDLQVVGAAYDGEFHKGSIELPGIDGKVDLEGALAGAFYGPAAEATAGLFAASAEPSEDIDVDLAGGFAAWSEDLIDDLGD